jgi:hypothetical protein
MMKGIFWKEGEPFSNSMSLIAFLLMRYPEIGSVRFDPLEKTLQFSFVVTSSPSEAELNGFRAQLLGSLRAIAELQGREPGQSEITFTTYEDLTFIEVTREIHSLNQEEIALLMGLVQQVFGGSLLLDQEEGTQEEDILMQEEMIEHMLEDLKDSRQEKRLIGFREEGRVLVFNRASLHK